MNPTFEALAAVCRDHPLRRKHLVVPGDRRLGHAVLYGLHHGGTPFANLQACTLADLAHEIAGPAVRHRGGRVVTAGEMRCVVEDLLGQTECRYFHDLAEQAGTVDYFVRAVMELRDYGLTAAALQPGAFTSRSKYEDLRRVLSAAEQWLAGNRCYDDALLIAEAAASGPGPCGRDLFILLEGGRYTPHTMTALQQLGVTAVTVPYAGTIPERDRRQDRLQAGIGIEGEAEGIFRAVLDNGYALDAVEIIAMTGDDAAAVYDAAGTAGIPVTLGTGLPAVRTRSGRAAGLLLDLLAGGGESRFIFHLLNEGLIAAPEGAAGLVRRAGPLRSLTALQASVKALESAGPASASVQELLNGLEAIRPEGDRVSVNQVLAFILNGIGRMTGGTDADRRVARQLREISEARISLFERRLGLNTAAARTRKEITRLQTEAHLPRPGHMHISLYRHAGWHSRCYGFCTGLQSGNTPAGGADNPVLLHGEKAGLAAGFPVPRETRVYETGLFYAALARFPGPIVYSCSLYDTLRERPNYPSPLMLQLAAETTGNAGLGLEELQELLAGRAAAAVDADGLRGTALPAALRRGIELAVERRGAVFTDAEGCVGASGGVFLNCADRPLAVTAAEELAVCPFRYFARRILRLEPTAELETDDTAWLDHAERGRILHSVFGDLMREAGAAGTPITAQHVEVIRAMVLERARETAARRPPASPLLYDEDVEELLATAERFVRHECFKLAEIRPLVFEENFGTRAEPLALDLPGGRTCFLEGRVDRINGLRDGSGIEIIDYKTGSARAEPGHPLAGGQRIQHALYALMAHHAGREGLRPVVRSGYFYPSLKGSGREVLYPFEPETTGRLLDGLLRVLEHGAFIPLYLPEGARGCRYCDYRIMCDPVMDADTVKNRLEAPADPGAALGQEVLGYA